MKLLQYFLDLKKERVEDHITQTDSQYQPYTIFDGEHATSAWDPWTLITHYHSY